MHQDVTTILAIIQKALAAMGLPDVVVGAVEKDDHDNLTFLVGDKELVVSRQIASSPEDAAKDAITTLLQQTLRD